MIVSTGLMALVILGCENTNEPGNGENPDVTGRVTDNTDCKQFESAYGDLAVGDTVSCIEYTYNASEQKLILKHINTGFNCCPESLYCSVSTVGDTIIIEEFELSSLCDCNCLFDMDIEITGIRPQSYYLKVIEPYALDEEKLYFEINLVEDREGSYCVPREHYPWAILQYNNNSAVCEQEIIPDSELYHNGPDDEFEFISAEIVNNCLLTTVEYSGGCGGAVFELYDAEQLLESYPPQKRIRLSLQDDDPCEALVREDLSFDLSPINEVGYNTIILNLQGWSDKLTYEY